MEGVSVSLNQVWSEFRRGGVNDDISIISQITDILLAIQRQSGPFFSKNIQKADIDYNLIKQYLRQALKQNFGDAGDLFDRYVLFRLDKMIPGGRYPTPRHIVHLMALLADSEGKQVADFASGSGGLLIHCPKKPGIQNKVVAQNEIIRDEIFQLQKEQRASEKMIL